MALALAARTGAAQVLRGEVRDAESKAPISGAAIVVRDSARNTVGYARTRDDGAFSLRVARSAKFVQVVRVGFAPESLSAPAFDIDTTNVSIEMTRVVVRLTAAVIEAERRQIRDTQVMGLNLKTLGTHMITPSEVANASRGARTYLDEIRSGLPAGVMINERSRCVGANRGRLFNGTSMCAMVYVDGVRVDDTDTVIELVSPGQLDHAIYINAADAGVRFGTGSSGGVLLLFTKFGGYALGRD